VRELSDDARLWLVEQALDVVPHALFMVDSLRPGRANMLVNTAYSALTGYEPGEAIAPGFDALAIFVEAAEVAALDPGHGQVSATKHVRVRRRDGTTFPVALEVHSVERGGDRYLVGLSRGRIRRPCRESRSCGAVRRRCERAPAYQRVFSWLSHELRSPLNACVMWLDVLALSPQPDKLAKAVEAIKRNLARQARLVSEISDAAKLSSGGLALHFEPVDVVALVKRELDAWQSLATAKQIEFRHRLELDAAPLAGDPARLRHALNQLVENAVGSTSAGGHVELRVHDETGNCAVEVADTGVADARGRGESRRSSVARADCAARARGPRPRSRCCASRRRRAWRIAHGRERRVGR
jgi:hypothetical protein